MPLSLVCRRASGSVTDCPGPGRPCCSWSCRRRKWSPRFLVSGPCPVARGCTRYPPPAQRKVVRSSKPAAVGRGGVGLSGKVTGLDMPRSSQVVLDEVHLFCKLVIMLHVYGLVDLVGQFVALRASSLEVVALVHQSPEPLGSLVGCPWFIEAPGSAQSQGPPASSDQELFSSLGRGFAEVQGFVQL